MSELTPGPNEILRIWWLILWRTVMGGAVIGFVLGLVIGFSWTMTTHTILPPWVNLALGGVIYLLWGPVVVKMALKKRYQGFRIVLVEVPAE